MCLARCGSSVFIEMALQVAIKLRVPSGHLVFSIFTFQVGLAQVGTQNCITEIGLEGCVVRLAGQIGPHEQCFLQGRFQIPCFRFATANH